MFASTVLSVAVGLIFVYFVFSMACSKINEKVASRLEWRADTLETWLRKSLGSPPDDAAAAAPAITADAFKQSSLITSVTSEASKKGLPSYLAPETFALALLDLLCPGDGQVATMDKVREALAALPASHPAKAPLTRIAIEAGNDLTAFRTGVERWFNNSMARVSGWYKRRVQRWMLAYALALTFLLNVDTLAVARTLWTQDAVREAVVARAQADGGATGSLDKVSTDVADVKKLSLPIGWTFTGASAADPRRWPGADGGALLVKLLGLAVTTGALTLGAPFWFDVLNRVARLRSSGDRPSTSTPSSTPPALAGTAALVLQPVALTQPLADPSAGATTLTGGNGAGASE